MPGVDLDLDLPSLSDPLSTIVSKLVTALSAIEDDLADRVTSGELDLDTAVSLGGNALTNVGGVRLLGGESAVVGTLYMDEELNIVTTDGVVQLTSGGAINVSSVGAIVGDYGGTNPASVYYDDASGEFRFTESTGVYADIVADDIKLMGDNGSVRIGVDVGLSGTKSILIKSLPAAGISLLAYNASDSTLVDAATVTVTNDVALTDVDCVDLACATLDVGFSASVGTTLAVGTTLTAVTVSASSAIKHAFQRSKKLGTTGSVNWSGTFAQGYSDIVTSTLAAGSAEFRIMCGLETGDRPQQVKVSYNKGGAEALDVDVFVNGVTKGSGSTNTVGAGTLTIALTATTITEGNDCNVRVTTRRVGDLASAIVPFWDRP